MAGNPIRRAERQRLLDNLEEFAELLEAGETDKQALADFGVNVGVLYKLERENSDVAERLARARKAGAAAMMSETVDIADELQLAVLADPVRVAQVRIQTRQKLASVRDRDQFGDRPTTAVQVNINGLHLMALKAATAADRALPHDVIEGELAEPAPLKLDDLL